MNAKSICLFLTWPSGFQLKSNFFKLLKETSGIDRHTRYSDIKKKINSDPRYEAVESSSRREEWYKEYIRNLSEVSFKDPLSFQLIAVAFIV